MYTLRNLPNMDPRIFQHIHHSIHMVVCLFYNARAAEDTLILPYHKAHINDEF